MASIDEDFWNWNATSLEPFEPSPTSPSKVMLIVGCCFSTLIVLFNLLLVASLIAGKNFNTFTVCVFHMAVLDIAVGAFVYPFTIAANYQETWPYGNIACKFWVTLDVFLSILIILTCSVINVERILEVAWPRYRLWREFWSWKHFLFIWIPWGTVLAVGVPLFVLGTNAHVANEYMNQVCFSPWETVYFVAFTITFSFMLFLLTVVTVISAVIVSVRAAFRTYGEDHPRGIIPSSVALVLVTMSVIVMMLPFNTLSFILTVSPEWATETPAIVITVLYWTSLCNSFVRPLCWFVDPEIRLGYATLFRKCCCCKGGDRTALHEANFNKVQCAAD